jgi:EAL domain-containing protein (putative c-di-GMP-specific phosphodiesterase class I)
MVDRGGELVAPGLFLPAVEAYNLSGAVDRWVVSHALQAIHGAQAHAPPDRFWTINLSGQSISDPYFHQFVIDELARHAIDRDTLCFEITETAAIAGMSRALEFMQALRTRGCRLALDDFGTGVSSFAYLKNLPVDYVKIDGEFVRDIVDDEIDMAMVRSINEIARLMGKRTIAEYVENDAILDKLRGIGVDYVQGYGVGRPQPIEGFLGPPPA